MLTWQSLSSNKTKIVNAAHADVGGVSIQVSHIILLSLAQRKNKR